MLQRSSLLLAFVILGCGAPGEPARTVVAPAVIPLTETSELEDDPVPRLRLPAGARPLRESLRLAIDPTRERFSGAVDIEVMNDRPRRVFWLHGQMLAVARVTVTPAGGAAIAGVWESHDTKGTVSVKVASPLPAGHVTLHVEYDAAFATKQEGLFKLTEGGAPYAFTQFENIAARQAFPCFDEPGLKIPWDVTLVVPVAGQVIANTREVSREPGPDEGHVQVHFARTEPLPSYLIAFAVGPLDVVAAPDIPATAVRRGTVPLRGVATHGRGKDLAYALAHAGEILATLEGYFGVAYPYDKVDVIAIPDMGGAMENAATLTFNDGLLLFDPATAPLRQRRDYGDVMTHELAHQWVGDLVTAAWWDDIWLNEAFATWLEAKADAWDPSTRATSIVIAGAQDAMRTDALVSSRSIRQPVGSVDDIANAFDSITYEKGGAVLRMFERWVGPETFRRGLAQYLKHHAGATATADDFLDEESRSAKKDVRTPFHTFLDQPGVPYVQTELRCDGAPRLHLAQSRYSPKGSVGGMASAAWQIPLCARYGSGATESEACTLLASPESDLPLGASCPDWVFPNSDAAGYFRFSLSPKDLTKLRADGYAHLTAHEKVALGGSLRAALESGELSLADAIAAAAPLAGDPHADVAAWPMELLTLARRRLHGDKGEQGVEVYARHLFAKQYARLGWQRRPADRDGEESDLRARVLRFLATTAADPRARSEATRRAKAYLGKRGGGVHAEAVDGDLVALVLEVLGEGADVDLWEELRARLIASEDAELRANLVRALSATSKPVLAERARELSLDKTLRATELLAPLSFQLGRVETQDDAWRWLEVHWEDVLTGVASDSQASLVAMTGVFCDEAHASEIATFLAPRINSIDGGPRELAKALESIRLCAATRAAHEASARAFFLSGQL